MEVTNKIKNQCEKIGWTRDDFIGECFKIGIGKDTSAPLYDGATNVRLANAVKIARLFKVQLDDIFEIGYGRARSLAA